jgi:hypothetical protein
VTDQGAPFQPGAEQITVPLRPRSTYAGYRAFGSGDGAVLVEPRVAHELRTAAELGIQERRVTGGLLYGHGWVDEQGAYLVINGFLEAGPGENRGDRPSRFGADEFTLSRADLRLLREDAARMYSTRLELGWWRTLAVLGEFSPRDFITQAELVGPDGVGLLVYGSGVHWGTAYLGPDGHAPDSAGTLVAEPEAVPGPPPGPGLATEPEAALGAEPERVDIAAGESLLQEPLPADAAPGTSARGRTRPRMPTRVRVSPRVPTWAGRSANAGAPGRETPPDVQLVIIGLAIVTVAAAIIVGVLAHSLIVAVIIAVVGLLVIFSTNWMARH